MKSVQEQAAGRDPQNERAGAENEVGTEIIERVLFAKLHPLVLKGPVLEDDVVEPHTWDPQ
jgi:hypothetical protein